MHSAHTHSLSLAPIHFFAFLHRGNFRTRIYTSGIGQKLHKQFPLTPQPLAATINKQTERERAKERKYRVNYITTCELWDTTSVHTRIEHMCNSVAIHIFTRGTMVCACCCCCCCTERQRAYDIVRHTNREWMNGMRKYIILVSVCVLLVSIKRPKSSSKTHLEQYFMLNVLNANSICEVI